MGGKGWLVLVIFMVLILTACSATQQTATQAAIMPATDVPEITVTPEILITQLTTPVMDIFSFPIIDENGTAFDLAAFQGEPLLLIFFSIHCSHCQHEAENLEALYNQYSEQMNIVALEVSGASNAEVSQFAADYGLGFAVASDASMELTRAMGVTGVPTNFLFRANGTLYDTLRGYTEPPDFEYAIDQMLLTEEK